MNQLSKNIETLALVSDPEQAEHVAMSLRDAGVATHQYWVEDHYSFAEQLASRNWDLVVLALSARNAHVPSCILRYPETPFIAIIPERKGRLSDELLELGITDVGTFSHPARLRHTIERALREASLLQQNLCISQQSQEQDKLLRGLMNSSEEAVAFVHQGLHGYVNPAWLRLFGLADSASAMATPLLDLVARPNRSTLKKILRDFQADKIMSAELETTVQRSDGGRQRAHLGMSIARFEGESVIQVRAKAVQALNNNLLNASWQPRTAPMEINSVEDPATELRHWTQLAGDILDRSTLHIAVRPLQPEHTEISSSFSLVPALVAGANGPKSIERFIAELRRLNLLNGLDRWALYNAASALAKQLKHSRQHKFYVYLNSDSHELPALALWMSKIVRLFDLPAGSLNLILDSCDLTVNSRLSMRSLDALRNLNMEIGVMGVQMLKNMIPGSDDQNLTSALDTSSFDMTQGLDFLEKLPVDFALLPQAIGGSSNTQSSSAELDMARAICARTAITPLIEMPDQVAVPGTGDYGEHDPHDMNPMQTHEQGHTPLDLTIAI